MNKSRSFARSFSIFFLLALALSLSACNPVMSIRPTATPAIEAVLGSQEGQLTPAVPPAQPSRTPTATVARQANQQAPEQPSRPVQQKVTATPTAAPAQPPTSAGSWQKIASLPRYINVFVVDPANQSVVYAGTGENGSGSGVYKSEDRGKTWRAFSKGLPNEDVTAMAFSRSAPFTLYAKVGLRGDVYGSTDNAANWTKLGNTGIFAGFWHRLVTSPGSNRTLFMLALGDDFARSTDGGHAWTPIRRGIPSDEHSVRVQALVIDPTNANVMYLGVGGFVGGGAGVYKSTDGGNNWSPANQGMIDYRIQALALDPQHPQTIYAGSDGGELFKSKDGAQTWEDLTDNLPFEKGRHYGIRQILIDPNRAETIYMMCDQQGVVRSTDSAATWNSLGKPEGEAFYVHSAITVLFGPDPVILVGDERGGPSSYTDETFSQ